MKIFGYLIIVRRIPKHNRPTASSYNTWSRKGRCPGCGRSQGSTHVTGCKYQAQLRKGGNRG